MPASQSYIAIFYDKDKPKTSLYADYKRISQKQFVNLSDGESQVKTVELFSADGIKGRYRIVETMTFNTISLIETVSYVVCIGKKVNF